MVEPNPSSAASINHYAELKMVGTLPEQKETLLLLAFLLLPKQYANIE
jgi:hypothetical protein